MNIRNEIKEKIDIPESLIIVSSISIKSCLFHKIIYIIMHLTALE